MSVTETIREALRGTERDLTSIPVGRAVALLAIPAVVEMFMESLFAIVDIFWVSKLGSNAVAVVGLTESMLAIVYAAAVGLSAGATALVSRRIGEGDKEGASRAVVQILGVGVAVAIVVGFAGAVLAPHLLSLMGGSSEVVRAGTGYTSVMLGGSVTVLLLFLINAVFRGAGDAAIAMRVLWLANGLNIVLGPLFIFGIGPFPELGVMGAAVGTTIGRGVGVLYQLYVLVRGRGRIAIGARHLAFDRDVMRRFLGLSGGGTLQSLVETTSWIGLIRILASFGSAALAGYTIAIRIALFALLPSWGIANAAATLVGQNLGAIRPDRAERSVWVAGGWNLAFLGSISIFFVAAPGFFVGLFSPEASTVPYAVDCLRIVALGFLFYAYGLVVVMAFNGAGDVRTPMLLNLACFWALKIPVAWVLAVPLGLGPRGVFIAIAVAYSTLAVVSALLFKRGRWKLQQV
ncbi:MAG: MATE family efflux transporter [Polyangiaceae bacterium]|nr:MATE family efflux transporter [Polyangiaceae bacterium]